MFQKGDRVRLKKLGGREAEVMTVEEDGALLMVKYDGVTAKVAAEDVEKIEPEKPDSN